MTGEFKFHTFHFRPRLHGIGSKWDPIFLRGLYTGSDLDLPQVYFVNQKKIGKGKIRKGESEIDCFVVHCSGRLITDDEIDLGQV